MRLNTGVHSRGKSADPESMMELNITPLIDVMWDREEIPDRAALEAKLAKVAALADQPEVNLRPNKLVPYKYVAGVMASAQRLGVARIGMVGNEQFQ